ncbi:MULTISPECIES: superoxide dismutase [unclassified Sphingomonas]|uniref:superoxide dismutase n=1 Tax=unclassified Sphingomonas TaxID=196159 RepID=UPI0006FBE8B3|nr:MULTISPECIES: superoxide dismutase [unclassified Sphingomonas]KQX25458.1 superoxide dismutase [Sphingomonas sp. Root1294]KQY66450.1 superoxide dismutase [Sphingomonas sp. Root50]KRB90233.1 superoxide dismutase [Sphingomonas sp. Root720]
MAFALPPLPFDRAALEPVLSAESFDYHHGKHHKAYVDKVNGWIDEKGLAGKSLVEVIRLAKDQGDKPLANNAGQIWNHDFFWQCLAPEGSTRPSDKLAKLIEASFGSQEALVEKLANEAVGHFGSGWAWLVLAGDALKITSLHDGETPLAIENVKPLLTLDVWEHAYYIDYRNERPRFAKTVLGTVVNWDFVSQNVDGDAVARGDQLVEA